jgi:hypothetical protein
MGGGGDSHQDGGLHLGETGHHAQGGHDLIEAAPDEVTIILDDGTVPPPPPPAPDSSPLHDYLQFADTHPQVGTGETADHAGSSPVDDYLAAAGVDPATVTSDPAADLPPTEVLLDTAHAGDGSTAPHDTALDDAALAAIPPDTLDQPHDDPQHHGV